MGFLLTLLLWAGVSVIGELLRPRPRDASASSLDDFDFPTAEEGRPIQVILGGTVKIDGANVVWYGDLQAKAIRKGTGGILGFFGLDKQVTVGYRYSLGIQHVLGWGPVDSVSQIQFDGRVALASVQEIVSGEVVTAYPTLEVLSRSRQTAPAYAHVGDRYIVAAGGPGGDPFTNQGNNVAECVASPNTYTFRAPLGPSDPSTPLGEIAVVLDERRPVKWNSAIGAWVLTGAEGAVVLDLPDFFGGADQEGGLGGTIRLHFGDDSQLPNAYLEQKIGEDLPAWPGQVQAIFEGLYVGNSPYIKRVSFVASAFPNELGLTGGMHKVGADANPACLLYRAMTNAKWGLGRSSGTIDVASFRAGGQTFWNEGLGLSVLVSRQVDSAKEAIAEIERHCDCIVFRHPSTGLWTLKLARADYDVGTIPSLDRSNVSSVDWQRGDLRTTKNLVRVRYVDRKDGFAVKPTASWDLANLQGMGGQVVEEDIDFLAFTEGEVAARAAARLMMAESFPLAPHTIRVNRKGWDVLPGSVFKLTWDGPPEAFVDRVLRAIRVRGGDLLSGEMTIDAVEDVFAVTWLGHEPPEPSGWEDPVTPPQPVAFQHGEQAPLFLLGSEPFNPRGFVLAARQGLALGYQAWTRPYPDDAGSLTYHHVLDVPVFTPTGTVVTQVSPAGDSITLANGIDLEVVRSVSEAEFAVGKLLLYVALGAGEFVAARDVVDNGDGTVTFSRLARGCPDTTPRIIPSGTRVWVFSVGAGVIDLFAYKDGGGFPHFSTSTKLLPYNPLGVLRLALATAMIVPATALPVDGFGNLDRENLRPAKTYVPAKIQISGLDYPATFSGNLNLSWLERNRLLPWAFENSGANGSRETDAVVVVKIYDQFNVLFHVEVVPLGTSTYTLAQSVELAESGRINTQLRVELFASKNYIDPFPGPETGDHSWARYDWTVVRV